MSTAKSTLPPEGSPITGTHIPTQHPRLLRLRDVLYRTGMSRSRVYAHMAEGQFPRLVKLGRSSAWLESEIEAWIAAKIAQRDQLFEKPSTPQ
ncbi:MULTISPECIES: helix-turn-helix transcriptional regulator [Rhodanobacter]|jgi:prophage regulatory protein|nr:MULTISPECIES: AlpA family transcriptional regulator [Rhodanobacter]UJJ56836.1 AlpA family transcriptional regulator [Rhodanobacter denitrificans]